MNNIYKLILVFTFFSFTCCTPKKQREGKFLLKLSEQPFTEIYIGKTNSPTTNCMQLINHKGKTLLAYQSRGKISFFNIDNGELFHKIQYEKEGPNGIEGLRSFYFVSFDTIYTFSGIPWYFFHTDSAGRVIKKHDISYLKVDEVPVCINADFYHFNNKIIRQGNKLHIPTYLYDTNLKNDITEYSMGILFDLLTDSAEFSDIKYPSISPTQYYYSRDFGDGKWIYKFIYMNDLYVTKNGEEYQQLELKSTKAPSKLPEYKENPDMKTSLMSAVSNPRYLSLVYDKWNSLFYLFFYPGEVVSSNQELSYYFSKIENTNSFSVTILNDDLEVIGETMMPEERFNPQMYFVGESGLHFALHINHPDFDPDYLKFARFTVEPVKE